MGAANGTPFRLVDADVELRRETREFARCATTRLVALSLD